MKERAATKEMTSNGITVVRSRPAATARAWFRRVATKTAARTVGAGKRVANAMATSWVLSPISARVTKRREAMKAVMGCALLWADSVPPGPGVHQELQSGGLRRTLGRGIHPVKASARV